MDEIRLKTGSWLDNAGIAGICNILNRAGISYSQFNNILSFDADALKHFGQYYFQYFTDKYESFITYSFITQKGQVLVEMKQWNEHDLNELNRYIERAKRYLMSNSYLAAYKIAADPSLDIVGIAKSLKKVALRKGQNVSDVQKEIDVEVVLIGQIVEYFKKPVVKKYVTAKNIAYTLITNFWNGVSFLHRSATNNDPMEEYEKYFIEPLRQYFETAHDKDKYFCFTCGRPLKKLSKPAAFDLAWMNKMGVDMARKSSHFWNLNSGTCYICPVCNFIYSCVPAGFTLINGQGYFVNSNSNLKTMVNLNNNGEDLAIREDETINLLELRTYYQIIKVMEQEKVKQSNREIENIQVIKYNLNNSVRPYSFNVLSKDKLAVMNKNKKTLGKMVKLFIKTGNESYLNVYENVIDHLYQNKNQFGLIASFFRNSIPDNAGLPLRNSFSLRQLIYLNNDFLWTIRKEREGKILSEYSSYVPKKTIDNVLREGQKLADVYIKKGAVNKMQGITYRLLNALKSKNIGRFMDTFFNAYLYAKNSNNLEKNLIIPTEISEALRDEDKLQTLGYAFILGFRSGKQLNNEEE